MCRMNVIKVKNHLAYVKKRVQSSTEKLKNYGDLKCHKNGQNQVTDISQQREVYLWM